MRAGSERRATRHGAQRRYLPMRVLAVALLGLALAHGVRAADDPEGFERGLERIRAHVQSGRASNAKRSMASLLKEHHGADYARVRRAELIDLAKRIGFALEHPTPEASKFVSGELIEWNPNTGAIRIAYTPKTAKDLVRRERGLLMFPAEFTGPFEVRIRGARYERHSEYGPVAYVGPTEDADGVAHTTRISFGLQPWTKNGYEYSMPSSIVQLEDDEEVAEDGRKIAPCKTNGRYRLEVRVRKNRVEAKACGKTLGKVKKPKDIFGLFYFRAPKWSDLEIEGTIEPSWIQSRIDELQEAERDVFASTFDPEEHLPSWLFEASTRTVGTASMSEVPTGTSRAHRAQYLIASAALMSRRFRKVEEIIESLEGEDAPALAGFLQGMLELGHYDLDEAKKRFEAAIEVESSYPHAELLLGIVETLEKDKNGEQRLGALRGEYAPVGRMYYVPTWLLMFDGRVGAARTVSRLAAQHGLEDEAKQTMDRALLMAENGPAWDKTYKYESKNYAVFSDMGEQACKDTARELERMFSLYQSTVANVRSDRTRKFKVYLFSGEAGFRGYMGRLRYFWGPGSGGAAGVYSPVLKQLLIWNLPRREFMMETVRHEGFHQFLDRFIPDAPTWFNEGMAVYYEATQMENGRLKVGEPSRESLRTLEDSEMLEIDAFFGLEPSAFYKRGHAAYAQAWAIVHFLRHSNSTWRQRYNDFIKRLGEVSGDRAMKEIFPEKIWLKLEMAVDRHIRELSDE